MKLTYYGHACFAVEINGCHLLFDPFISPNELARHINLAQVKADYILLSHGHADHVADAINIAQRNDAMLVSNYEIITWFASQGYPKGHPMNHGGTWEFDFGKVKYVNAVHSSALPDDSYGGNPGGFVITSSEGNFYYSGDTALTMDMKLIPMSTNLDFAVLCIGDNFTMGIDDAVLAADFVECDKIVGVHYDTFGFIKIDHGKAKEAFRNNGKELILAGIGETIEV